MTSRSGFLPTPIRMTSNDPECPIQLKVRLPDGTLDVRMLWLSELTMRDWLNMGLNCQRQKCGQWTVVSKHVRFVRLSNDTNTDDLESIYNVWKLHRPRMSDGLLADSVDTSAIGSLQHDQLASIERHPADALTLSLSLSLSLSLCGSWASCFISI